MNTRRIGLLIEPLDVLFCRDGRPFGESSVVTGGLPQPQTLAGAVRTHILRRLGLELRAQRTSRAEQVNLVDHIRQLLGDNAALADVRFRGPWLARLKDDGRPEVMLPTPADLVVPAKRIHRLRPRDGVPGWVKEHGLLPLWLDGGEEVKPAGGYLPLPQVERYLRGQSPDWRQLVEDEDLYTIESRTGIGVNPQTQSVAESMIYSTRVIRLRRSSVFYFEMDWPEEQLNHLDEFFPTSGVTIGLGGEGRLSRVERLGQPVSWPKAPQPGACILLLITAAHFDQPPHNLPTAAMLGESRLVAAAVPGSTAISGWDMSRKCPKPTRRFVCAGSVFYLDRPPRAAQLADEEDARLGYGIYLMGASQ